MLFRVRHHAIRFSDWRAWFNNFTAGLSVYNDYPWHLSLSLSLPVIAWRDGWPAKSSGSYERGDRRAISFVREH